MLNLLLLLAAGVGFIISVSGEIEPLAEVNERIWRGQDSKPGQFPYQALLYMVSSNGGRIACGGSLISTNYVLTAGHCCQNISRMTVFLGMVSLAEVDNSYVLKLNVTSENIIPHEQYDEGNISNDICLVRLPSTVQTNENISTVALPSQQDTNPSQYDWKRANISGWGQTNNNEGLHSRQEWSTVMLKSHLLCVMAYYSVNQVTNGELCSGRIPWTGPCHGDSGGPLTIQDATGKTVEIGLVSWGVGGCSSFLPDVYTYVPAYLDWIHQHMT